MTIILKNKETLVYDDFYFKCCIGKKGITSFGVEAFSPGTPGKNNFEVHNVCRDMGFTHIEGLANLDKLIGKGRFKFIGLPLRIRGGTGSPIRAVAVFNNN